MFMKILQISPFSKAIFGQNPVTASIRGNQLELFKYFVEGIDQIRSSGDNADTGTAPKYIIKNPADRKYFIKSMGSHGHRGNNFCHFIFEKKHTESRYKFL